MLSGKLVHLIESHEDEITANIVRSIHRHSELGRLGALPEAELRDRGHEILCDLGYWLAHSNEERLTREYEALGRQRFERNVPLEESIEGLLLFKDKILDFVEEHGGDQDNLAWYAAEQFERRIGRLFDLLVIHLARGYQKAWRLHTAA